MNREKKAATYVVVELKCGECELWWTRRMPSEPAPDLSVLAKDATKLHQQGRSCKGTVEARFVVSYDGELESVLRRNRLDAIAIGDLCRDEIENVASRAALLGIPVDLAAAVMYAERARRQERFRLVSPLEHVVGLGSTAIAGSSSANICVQPQVNFRPENLVIPPDVARDFLITDFKVGKNSQLVSIGAIPAHAFSSENHTIRLDADVCQVAMFLTISVTNQNCVARNFQGAIVGHEVDRYEPRRQQMLSSGIDSPEILTPELRSELDRVIEQHTWEFPVDPESSLRLLDLLRLGLVARDAAGRYLATIEGAVRE